MNAMPKMNRRAFVAGSAAVGGGAAGRSAQGGASAQGGSFAQGGSGACSGPCSGIGCAVGSTPMTLPGSCCPVCVPNVACGPCMPPLCSVGFHSEVPVGQCCPVCVPNPGDEICLKGKADYAMFSQQIVMKYQSVSCLNDVDCTVVSLSNACSAGCQPVALVKSLADSLVNNLSQTAATDCATCGPPPPIACPVPSPRCNNGQCTLYFPN